MNVKATIDRIDVRRFRFWFQLFAFAFLVYGGWLAVDLGNSLPTFACGYNRKGTAGVCYLLPLQHQLAQPWSQLFSKEGLAVLGGFALFLLWFLVLNKAWCGFICPLGTLQDWITGLRKRFGLRYSSYSDEQFAKLTWIKYGLLLVVIFVPLLIGGHFLTHDWGTAYCQLCPARMIIPLFNGDFSQWKIDFSSTGRMVLTALGMFIAGLFLAGSFLKKRFFCFFCPMSAFHYIFAKLSLFKLKKEGSKCTVCGDCYRVCDLQIKPIADDVISQDILKDDCILCMKCVAACPEQGALRVDILGKTVFESTKDGFAKRMGMEDKQ
ncbi:MAG: 4Fe-4S binding protein [Methylomonas sp.]|nr:4Fe-4S binding protein [Methylomonas sp.]